MTDEIRIVLFEDTPATQSLVKGALEQALGADGSIVVFHGAKETAVERERTYEERLFHILQRDEYQSATLLVVDRDLSKSVGEEFRGLAVGAVATAAARLAVPICSYAREQDPDHWRREWQEGHLALDFEGGEHELARRAVIAARGFQAIANALSSRTNLTSANSVPRLLADLLGVPEFVDKIALYSVGDQARLADLPEAPVGDVAQIRRLGVFLGYWLHDSLLRFPGVLVNDIAAGSYLNIAQADFAVASVRKAFDGALYRGPFADDQRPQWWRGKLDDVISGADCADGLEFVRRELRPQAAGSTCYVNPTQKAGYYCIIARQPVSLENSKGGFSWFPRGADLTRIGITKFEEYGPWLGG